MAPKLNIDIINRRGMVLLLTIVCIVVIVTGFFYFQNQLNKVREGKNIEFSVISKMKINQLGQWQKECRSDVVAISHSPLLVQAVERLLIDKNNNELKEAISRQISLFRKESTYQDIVLATSAGEPILSGGLETDQFDTITSKKIAEAVMSRNITWTDLYYSKDSDKINYDIIAPLVDGKGTSIAALVFRIDPNDFLFPLIQSYPTPSKSSESLLVRKENDSVVFLNELRHRQHTALRLKIPLTAKEVPAVQAVFGYTGLWDGKDYRGIDVIADIQKVPNTDWFIITKIDKSEMYADMYREGIYIIIGFFLILLLVAGGLVFLNRYRQRNIYKELWKTSAEHSATLQSIGDAVISTNKHGLIQFMNKVAEQLTGWDAKEAKGKNLTEVFNIINEKTRVPVENTVEKVIREKSVVGLTNHTLLISKEGKEISIAESAAPIYHMDGEIIGVVLVFKDQTEVWEAQKKVNSSELSYRRLFESSKDGILILDEESGMIKV